MNKLYFLKLAQYNVWANNIVINWLNQITEDQWNTKLVGSMDSISATCTHIAGAEKIWLERLENRTEPFLSANFSRSKSELVAIWHKASHSFEHYISEIEETDFEKSFDYLNKNGDPFTSKKSEVLAHVFNHSTYHRGQIVNYLRQIGFTAVSSTDLITYYRLKV